jgi:F-type H+-transporting ATPase subunit a
MEHELGLTALFNQYLAGPGNALRHLIGLSGPTDRPWDNSIVMEILVVALLVVTVAILRSSLSVDKPGKLQHIFEIFNEFFTGTVDEVGIHHGKKYIPYIGTIFIFILSMNLIGIIPAFESPTNSPWVPAGLAVVTFLYFNAMGFQAHGIKYLAHFAGPVRFPHPLGNAAIIVFMCFIEVISLFIRPLSLTVRLYGNMFAGEQVTTVFRSGLGFPTFWANLSKLVLPVGAMGLHVFVALIQAYVFFLLTTIYIGLATAHEGEAASDAI